MSYILIFVICIINLFISATRKFFAKHTEHIGTSKEIYLLLAHTIAVISFFAMSKGNVPLNIPTFLFSVVYAVVAIVSVMVTLTAYNRVNLVYVGVFSGAGAIIIPYIIELLFRNETFHFNQHMSMLAALISVVMPLIFDKNERRGNFVCVILFFASGAASIIPKLYADYPTVASDTSFFFWTNVISLPMLIGCILHSGGTKVFENFKKISFLDYIFAISATILGNIVSRMSFKVLTLIPATTYTIITNSLGMVFGILASIFMFKEKPSKQTYICAAISVVAITLNVIK